MILLGCLLLFPAVFAVGEYLWYRYIVCWYYAPDSFKRIQYEAARNGEKPVRAWVYYAGLVGCILILWEVLS
jgi:hypothetical protein